MKLLYFYEIRQKLFQNLLLHILLELYNIDYEH